MTDQVRVLIVDDHDVVREGLRTLVQKKTELTVVGEADSVSSAVAEARREQPDVIIMGCPAARRKRHRGVPRHPRGTAGNEGPHDLAAQGHLNEIVPGSGLNAARRISLPRESLTD